jgi:hypothetical protein
VINIVTANVGGFAPAMTHVRAASAFGVVNADPRPRRTRGDVCLSTPAVQLQGTTLPIATQVMGDVFDKYRTGSHARDLTG